MSDEQSVGGKSKAVSAVEKTKVPKTRSPNFPFITLQVAIQRARDILRTIGRMPTSEEVIAESLKLSMKSSTFRLGIAAMRYYGLLAVQPAPKGDLLKLTPLALDIIDDYPDGSPQQREAIQKAALSPRIHNTIYEKYGPTLPADAEVRRFLIREHEPPFNDNTVADFITKYKTTMAFAGFGSGDTIDGETGAVDEQSSPEVVVGDLVQWTSGGSDMFPDPRPVLGLSEDGQFVFVPGTSTGIPVDQITVASRTVKPSEPKAPPPNPFANTPPAVKPEVVTSEPKAPPPGFKEDAYDLAEGRAVLRWPEKMDAGSVEELEEWFGLIVRKMRRTNGLDPKRKAGEA